MTLQIVAQRSRLILLLAASLGLWAAPAQANSMINQIVRGHCINAVNSEVRASGGSAPSGMADFTCDCVVQEMGRGRSVSQASTTCRNLAIQKYGL